MRRHRWLAVALGLVLQGCHFRSEETPIVDAGQDSGELANVDLDSAAGQGYLSVRTRGCAACHQSPDPTDGVLSGQTTPVPGTLAYGSNLTPDPDTGMDFWDAGTIATSVLDGVDEQGSPLCSAMPAYVEAGMGSEEALAIAAYLRSLPPVWRSIPASQCTLAEAGAP
jgi:mono/diheme cytochrome c family protein